MFVITSDDGSLLYDKGPSSYHEKDNIQFTQPRIEMSMGNINQMKADGPDEPPTMILKEIMLSMPCHPKVIPASKRLEQVQSSATRFGSDDYRSTHSIGG